MQRYLLHVAPHGIRPTLTRLGLTLVGLIGVEPALL